MTATPMHLVAAGLTFRSAPLAVRERTVIGDAAAHQLLRYLVGHSGLSAAAVMSTCNRTEFYVIAPSAELAAEVVPRLSRYLTPDGPPLHDYIVAHAGDEAVSHLFRVAAGLESMVVGEAQVLGQFKRSHELAREAGALDARLDFVMRQAISAGKRVRTETTIGSRAGGLGELAVEVARDRLGSLHGRGVLIVGAGATAALAARRLVDFGAVVTVASRGESALKLARQIGADAISVEDIGYCDSADLIISCTNSPVPVIEPDSITALQLQRDGRQLLVIDLAVPRDVHPEVRSIAGVELLDVDDLGSQAISSSTGGEIAKARDLVASEVERTIRLLSERDLTAPTIAALTGRAERLRRAEVERAVAKFQDWDPVVAERIDQLTQSLVRKLLHAPISHLRRNHQDPASAMVVRQMFELDETDPESSIEGEPQAEVAALGRATPR